MSSYIFPGFPSFLKSAAEGIGHPESAAPASRIVPLTALANLCAQAAQGDPAHAPGILAKAAEFRDQIAVALRAAELMLADVEAGRDRPAVEPQAEMDSRVAPASPLDPRKAARSRENPHDRIRDR